MIIKEIAAEDTWPIRQLVMWPEKPIEFVKIRGDEEAQHYGLYKGDKLMSVISCFNEGDEMQFRKFATLVDEQGQGLGTYLLNHVLDVAREQQIRRLWCNARRDKMGFYEKFGLQSTEATFVKAGIEYVIMERILK
ncbi:GNAT family N-acetyltransferase [Telluribacter humicola]|uniref:GNAT family N-acetyltransferase n=1 Tax=Telluribacter humicola TaxID=1720261 RepID=UPI001E31A4CA|nr:GNAT family N-acetyltransferase [Telluribacter humicola]